MFNIRQCSFICCFLILLTLAGSGWAIPQGKGLWREVEDSALRNRPMSRTRTPDKYRTFELNKQALRGVLAAAPEEFRRTRGRSIIELPMPDGTLARFRIEHSLVVEPGLLDKYPELGQTYRGYGIDDPTATVRFDMLPSGFHAMILGAVGTVLIDPYAAGDTDNYVSYLKGDLPRTTDFKCLVGDKTAEKGFRKITQITPFNTEDFAPDVTPDVTSGTQLRTYRLALAADNEYCVAVGNNTVAGSLAAEVLIMNRVNGVYERDVAIHMNIIANNNLITFAGDNLTCGGVACTSANDPYTDANGSAMLTQNQTKIDAVIGTANYDIGHVFSTGGGGIAQLHVPCTTAKAEGVTGLPNPVGDAFAIDYVAHEMGHEWGANHTFNSSCGGNRASTAAYEPGSGITIMAYAGVCDGIQELAAHSIDTFHVRSLEEITVYSQTGAGNGCAVQTASGNTPPSVSVVGGPTFNIPKQTPFTLTATGSDVNGDTLTYDWQEYDLGTTSTIAPNTDATAIRPIFRPYSPTATGTRTFPAIQYILANANTPPSTFSCAEVGTCMTGELLPTVARTMKFQVVARDNHAGAGGINTATATVVVDANSGPFAVTIPNTALAYLGNSVQTVTWNAVNTANAPVSAANVKISFSSDGGLTFPTVLLASTPNNGSASVTIPNVTTTTARIKVEAVGNIFFDISDANFSVTAVAGTVSVSGQVFTADLRGLRNAVVVLTDPVGVSQTTTTDSFGAYQFNSVLTGQTYTISVISKHYRFISQQMNITTALTGVNFTGDE